MYIIVKPYYNQDKEHTPHSRKAPWSLLPPGHPCFSPQPQGTTDIFLILQIRLNFLEFHNMESQRVYLQHNYFELHPCCSISIVHVFLFLNSSPWYAHATISLCIPLLIYIWIVSSLGLLGINLLCTFVGSPLMSKYFHFLLINPKKFRFMIPRSQMSWSYGRCHLNSLSHGQLFSEMVAPVYIPSRRAGELQLLFTSTWYCWSFNHFNQAHIGISLWF